MGKFIAWQIKRWLVPALVILGVMVMSLVIISATENLTYTTYHDPMSGLDYNYATSTSTFFMAAMLYGSLVSIVFPMFVFNYKFGIRRADFYKQLPFGANQLRRIIFVMGLVIAIIGTSLAFLTSVGILLIRYLSFDKSSLGTTIDPYSGMSTTTALYDFNYRYLLIAYLLLVLNVFATYSISCVFVYQ